MKHRIIFALFSAAAALMVIAALRDVFAPGFLSITPRVMGTSDILMEFAAAAVFVALAVLTIVRPATVGVTKK